MRPAHLAAAQRRSMATQERGRSGRDSRADSEPSSLVDAFGQYAPPAREPLGACHFTLGLPARDRRRSGAAGPLPASPYLRDRSPAPFSALGAADCLGAAPIPDVVPPTSPAGTRTSSRQPRTSRPRGGLPRRLWRRRQPYPPPPRRTPRPAPWRRASRASRAPTSWRALASARSPRSCCRRRSRRRRRRARRPKRLCRRAAWPSRAEARRTGGRRRAPRAAQGWAWTRRPPTWTWPSRPAR